MTKRDVRIGHLISPFGPGSIYTDRDGIPYVIAGLDHWFPSGRGGPGQGWNVEAFEFFEPRLSTLLGVKSFRRPPDFRAVRRGTTRADNSAMKVPVLRFPCWYSNSKSGVLRRFKLHTTRLPTAEGGGKWRPVRFVAVCERGHLCEFPWKAWVGCECSASDRLRLDDRGGADLSSVVVRCGGCGRYRTLAGAMSRPGAGEVGAFQRFGISCSGARPWLGEVAGEICPAPLVGALINQTNIHFADVMSSIRLPEGQGAPDPVRDLCNKILDPTIGCGQANMAWSIGLRDIAVGDVLKKLVERGLNASEEEVRRALEICWDAGGGVPEAGRPSEPESREAESRREEFSVLREPFNDPKVDFLRSVAATVPDALTPWISRVVLVEKLRETRAFFGFTRLVAKSDRLAHMPGAALEQLFKDPPTNPAHQWLPAVAVHGEGIYLEFQERAITDWQERCREQLEARLDEGFVSRLYDAPQILWPLTPHHRTWASRYLLVHTLSHILINQLVFECGYSTASLRERLYISADPTAPMAGVLIYTAAGDSDGTLGGLVRQGLPELLEPMVRRALNKAWWCGADPICSEAHGSGGARRVNLAGCHGCVLLPETSCETINNGLDRAMVVGTPMQRDFGFMNRLVQDIGPGLDRDVRRRS